MKSTPEVDSRVAWKWLGAVVEGTVLQVIAGRAEIVSKGKLIVRNGSEENPAIVILHKSGNEVVKLQSELIGDGEGEG